MASDGERALGNALKAVRDVGDLDRRVAALQERMLAHDAELDRLRRVEAAARRLAGRYADGWHATFSEDGDGPYCVGCGNHAHNGPDHRHAPDCAAMALAAALADDPGGTA